MATDKKMESRRSTLKTKAKEFLYELISLIIYRYYWSDRIINKIKVDNSLPWTSSVFKH